MGSASAGHVGQARGLFKGRVEENEEILSGHKKSRQARPTGT